MEESSKSDYSNLLFLKDCLIDIKESVDQAVKADLERYMYLFSNDIHYIPAVLKFDKKIIVGHYPTVLFRDTRHIPYIMGRSTLI